MNDDELLEVLEQRERYMILYRFQNCVKNMLKAKQNNETRIPKSWIDRFDMPSITFEYSVEQCEKMQEVKEDLECLAKELGLIFQD